MLVGVDVGGTFSDAALLTGDDLVTAKAPSTPRDQSEGVIAAVEAALDRAGAAAGDVERFVHGMTVGTNALLEGKVARTALFATEGFTDLEELGRQARAELYGLCAGHPPPLVPAELRAGVMVWGGGVAAAATAARHGSWTVLSGPAGGAVGAARLAERAGAPDAVCLDMGGTSCDVSVTLGGRTGTTGGREVGGRAL